MAKANFKIEIAEPCTVPKDQFSKVERGYYCARCSKCVIDYTHYSDQQIFREITNKSGKGHCGMFTSEQLEKVYKEKPIKKYGALSSVLLWAILLTSRNSNAQSEITIDTAISVQNDTSLTEQDSIQASDLKPILDDSAVVSSFDHKWIELSAVNCKSIIVIAGYMEMKYIPAPRFESILDSSKNALAGIFTFFSSRIPKPELPKNPHQNNDRPLWLESLRRRWGREKKK